MTTKPDPWPIWLWMNLLSLDAPLVALVWQDFLARCYHLTLLPVGRLILGLTVWAIYIADRLLDVRNTDPNLDRPRHAFYRHYRQSAALLLILLLICDCLIAWLRARPAVFDNGLLVAAGVLIYLAVFAAIQRIRVAIFKPVCAAVLFTAGVFLVSWTNAEQPVQTLGWPAVAFFLLCLGNLTVIERWEFSRATRSIWIVMATLAVVTLVVNQSRWCLAIAASSLGISALALSDGRLSQDARRVLADVALLSPLLLR